VKTLVHAGVAGAPHRAVAILNGSYSEPQDLVREGFFADADAHALASEVIAAELRASWFADGTIVDRIREHVVAPAQARGHRRIWLGGISLGALSALAYAARREQDLEGLVLLSPYPGARDVLREIDAAGGLPHWQPAIPDEGDFEREAWQWLARREPLLPVRCWFGRGDRFVEGQRRMAATLDPDCVHEREGGHDWPAWRAFWQEFAAEAAAVAS
jgi:pimeloyl-ACP methyl ester carboxylesterase